MLANNYYVKKILEWASHKTGLNLAYFFSNGAWVTLRFGVIAITGFAISVAFTRFTTKEVLGQYQFIVAIFGLLILFSLPGMSMAVMKAMAKGNDRSIYTALKITLTAGLLATPLIVGYGLYQYFEGVHQDFAFGIILAGLCFPLFNASLVWIIPYNVRLQFAKHAVRTIITQLFVTGGLFIGLINGANVLMLVAIYLGVNIILNGFFLIEVLRTIKSGNEELDTRYGIESSFQKFVYNLSGNLPPILISYAFGFEFVAIFYITNAFINFISGFVGGLTNLYLPLLFKYQIKNYKKIIAQNLGIGLIFFCGGLIMLKLFFLRLYGMEYYESLILAYLLAPVIIFLPLRLFLTQLLTAKEKNMAIVQSYAFANFMGATLFLVTEKYGAIPSVTTYIFTTHLLLLGALFYFLNKNMFFREKHS